MHRAFMVLMLAFLLAGCGGGSSSATFTAPAEAEAATAAATPTPTPTTATLALQVQFEAAKLPAATRTLVIHLLDAARGTDVVTPMTVARTGDVVQEVVFSGLPAGDYTLLIAALDASGATVAWSRQPVMLAVGQEAAVTVATSLTLSGLAVSPPTAFLIVGGTVAFSASGTFSDGSSAVLTGIVSWASSNTAAVSIDASGLATAASTGSAEISASLGGQVGTAQMTASTPGETVRSVMVSPVAPTIAVGATQQFTATATFMDGHTVDVTSSARWTSSDPTVATVADPGGSATGVAPGTSTITATYRQQGQASLTVTP
jgi:hypothetical protein